MRAAAIAMLLAAMLLSAGASARADAPRDVRRSFGPALAVGMGHAAGGAGAQLSLYADMGHPRLQLGGLLGLGHTLYPEGPARESLGATVGAFGSFGRGTHRMYFDLVSGSTDIWWLGVSEDVFRRRYWTVGSTLGYEVLTRRGFLMRASLGPAVAVLRGTLWDPIDRFQLIGQMVLGWKPW